MLASGSGKRAVLPTAAPDELRTSLMAATLPPLLPTPQSKEVWMDDAWGDNPGDNDVAVATTPIQTVKTLKIHKPDFYYGDQDKLKGWLYQVQVNIRFQQNWLKFKADQALYASAYCREKAWDFIEPATTQFLECPQDE